MERQPVPQGGAYPAGGGYAQDDDISSAADHASRHAGESTDRSLFSSLVGSLSQKKQSLATEEIDEDDAVKQHKRYFDKDDDDDDADDKSMGSAAAMQALKLFTSSQSSSAPVGGPPYKSATPYYIIAGLSELTNINYQENNSQSAFIGLAMAEASKLFDQKASQGKVSGDSSKESAVLKAGEMALKMYLKSGGGASESSAGSASGLINLAAKFMK
ncbi:hypothetical protein F5X96DRAFT_669144 [Biscogniauxia mediterranea]|nr:hypothetical protein F5X96DRAFT_669144 [Biscogniauxia mediterranea]